MFLEQPAPPPPAAVQKISEGGGAEIERLSRFPRQQPFLQFEFRKGFLVTGTIRKPLVKKPAPVSYPLTIHIPITGSIQGQLTAKIITHGQVQGQLQHTVKIRGTVTHPLHLHWPVHGEITENVEDLERDIADLKYILDKKRKRRKD